jgi:hypothetical protein
MELVAAELKKLGFNAFQWHTGGNVFCVGVRTEQGTDFCAGSNDVVWGMDVTDSEGEHVEDANLQTDMLTDETDTTKVARALAVEILSYEFTQLLKRDLTVIEWEQMRRRNRAYKAEGKDCCASQDIRDANMIMHEAFLNLGLKTPIDHPIDSPEHCAGIGLWNESWDRAKAIYLTA